MSIYVGTSEIKNIYVGTTPVKEVYVGTTKVRPTGWSPTSTILLYMPLNSQYTYTDQSGLNRSTTNTGVTFGTYQGVDCGQFANGRHIQVNTMYAHNFPLTVLVWGYNTGVYPSSRDGKIYDARNGGNNWIITSYDVEGGRGWTTQRYNYDFSTAWRYQNQWILAAFVLTSTSMTRYVKNSSYNLSQTLNTARQSNFTPTYINIGNEWNNGAPRYFIGYMSELIVDNKARTAQEITDYYNLTKSKYGL